MRRSFAFSQTAACGGTRRRATFPSERAPPRSASAYDQWREVRVAFRVSHGGLVASKQISGGPCRRPAESSRVSLVSDMAGVVLLIRRTVMAFLRAEGIHGRRSIG